MIRAWKNLGKDERSFLTGGLLLIIGIGLFFIIFIPWFITRESISILSYKDTGPIGDTINGIAGPFIALLAAILTFFAFYIQYQANVQQRKQFIISLRRQNDERKEQEKIWRIERFENRFYELIKLHKANVDEMNIADRVYGRKCFIHMFYELRFIYKTVERIYLRNTNKNGRKGDVKLIAFCYKIFFFGLGPYSEKYYLSKLTDDELKIYEEVKEELCKIQEKVEDHFKINKEEKYFTYNLPVSQIRDNKTIEFYYYPFDGHVNRLGHYFRHLYQSATYITQESLNENEKYGYIKTLRAQLSNFEQLLLYYNALAWFDEEWREIFTKYRFIKNLPLPLADFDKHPTITYEKEIEELKVRGIAMFE